MGDLVLVRCGVCGIFAPQKLGYGGKIVSTPCAHRAWREFHYTTPSPVCQHLPSGGRTAGERTEALHD